MSPKDIQEGNPSREDSPSSREGDKTEREKRVLLFIERMNKRENLWSGAKLARTINTSK